MEFFSVIKCSQIKQMFIFCMRIKISNQTLIKYEFLCRINFKFMIVNLIKIN